MDDVGELVKGSLVELSEKLANDALEGSVSGAIVLSIGARGVGGLQVAYAGMDALQAIGGLAVARKVLEGLVMQGGKK